MAEGTPKINREPYKSETNPRGAMMGEYVSAQSQPKDRESIIHGVLVGIGEKTEDKPYSVHPVEGNEAVLCAKVLSIIYPSGIHPNDTSANKIKEIREMYGL